MTTWISKILIGAFGLSQLPGCDVPVAGSHLTQANLAAGQVVLTAPQGYCIDKRSLRQTPEAGFALLARCDTLGMNGFFAAQELALITVTTAPHSDGAREPTMDDLSAAAAPARVVAKSESRSMPLVRITSDAPVTDELSPEHWRGAFMVNGQLVGLALYAPSASPALGREGADMLRDLADRTRKASAAAAASAPAETAPDPVEKAETATQDPAPKPDNSPFKLISGLFE